MECSVGQCIQEKRKELGRGLRQTEKNRDTKRNKQRINRGTDDGQTDTQIDR